MPTRGLTQWQVGPETTWGEPVAGTAKLMGMQDGAYLQSANRSDIYPDIRGSLAPAHLAGLEQIAGAGEYESLLTFEDACYYFDNAAGQATPSGTGPYTRAYAAPIATPVTPRILTFIHGSSQTGGGVWKLTGGLVNSIKIKGQSGKPTMISGDLIGKKKVQGALASLTDRTVEVVMGAPWLVYLDAWGGTIGSTQLVAAMVAFEMELKMNRVLGFSEDSLEADTWEQNPWEGQLKLTLRLNAAVKAEIDAVDEQTGVYQRQVRLKQTSGTKSIQLDFAGTQKEAPKTYDDEDGMLTAEWELNATYNPTLANWWKAQVANALATLP